MLLKCASSSFRLRLSDSTEHCINNHDFLETYEFLNESTSNIYNYKSFDDHVIKHLKYVKKQKPPA